MEEQIVITKSELKQLIAIEIAKRQSPKQQQRDFRNVAINCADIMQINHLHKSISEKLRHKYRDPYSEELLTNKSEIPDDIFSRKRNFVGWNEHVHRKVYTANVHDELRRISLAVMGATIIKDLDSDEFDFALDVYEEFKKLFLDKYNQRLNYEEQITQEV